MFQQLEDGRAKTLPRYALFSLVIHGLVIVGVFIFALLNARPSEEKKAVDITFKGPGHGPGAPPPPPPPGGKSRPHSRKVMHKIEIPKQMETPRLLAVKERPKEEKPEPEDEGEPAGVQGGVIGGVVGGVVGGIVGSNGGGGTAPPPPPPPAEMKPKNVPAFVLKRDELNVPPPRMSEVYKTTHRGQMVSGAYRVCVGTDGHVFEVQVVTSIPGADTAMVDGIKEEWLYRGQRAPVCFLYNASVVIE